MKKSIVSTCLIMAFVAIALVGCFTVPDPNYVPIDPDVENAKTPHITNVSKDAMWTDESLVITGTNFSDSLDENFVYFFTVNEPVGGTTTIVKDSLIVDGTYNVTNYFKNINVTTNDYVTTITSVIAGVTTVETFRAPTSVSEYTTTDSTTLVRTTIETTPVFTQFDTTVAGIDTTGYTKMVRTVTTIGDITDWLCHTAELGTVTAASSTQLTVIPPEVDVINAKIAVHNQHAIAPAEWGFIDLMVKP